MCVLILLELTKSVFVSIFAYASIHHKHFCVIQLLSIINFKLKQYLSKKNSYGSEANTYFNEEKGEAKLLITLDNIAKRIPTSTPEGETNLAFINLKEVTQPMTILAKYLGFDIKI